MSDSRIKVMVVGEIAPGQADILRAIMEKHPDILIVPDAPQPEAIIRGLSHDLRVFDEIARPEVMDDIPRNRHERRKQAKLSRGRR